MPDSRIIVLGECVADAFTADAAVGELALRVLPGGGPANIAVALARLGTPTGFLGRISADVFGALFTERFEESGVDLSGVVRAAEPSTLAVAAIDPAGQAAYSFHAEGAADWQWNAAELAAPLPASVRCLHTGSLALVREPGADVIEEFLTRVGATVSIDPNIRPRLVAREHYLKRLARWCALADVLRLSEDDLAVLRPGDAMEKACDEWHTAGVPLVVVTRGENGAVVSLRGERITVAGLPTTVVDTIGAGDSFTAGLLHTLDAQGHLGGRLDSLTIEHAAQAAAFAVRVATLTCTAPGANPPWLHQLS